MNTTKLPDELRQADEFDIEFMDFFEEKKPAAKKPAQSQRPRTQSAQGTRRPAQSAQGTKRPAQSQAAKRPAGTQPTQKTARPAGTQPTQKTTRPVQQRPVTQQAARPTQGTTAKRPVQQRPAGNTRPTVQQPAQRQQRPAAAGQRPVQGTPAKRPASVQRQTQGTAAKRPAQQRPVTAGQRPSSTKQTTRPAPKLQHPAQSVKQTARPKTAQQAKGQRPTGRPQTAQQAKAKGSAKPKTKSKFKKAFLISWAAFVVVLIAALVLLTIFLSNFEKGRPTSTIAHIVRNIENGDLDDLHLKTSDGTPLDSSTILCDESEISNYILQKAESANEEESAGTQGITYRVINGESDETKKTYLVKAGDEKVLKVCIERSNKKYLFGFTGWEETETTLLADAMQVTTLRAQIPHDSQLSVNGTVISRDRIVSENDRISLLSRLINEGLIGEQPGMDTYEVPGIYFQKDVKLIDASGTEHETVRTNDIYTGGYDASQEFIDSQYDRVIDMFEPYALYFSGERGRGALNEVMVEDSPAYNSAVSADVSWMQEHSDVEITDKKAEHFKQYSDQVFSCDISFLQTIYQGEEAVRTWDTNMTWIFIWDSGNFYVADFVTRAADEG